MDEPPPNINQIAAEAAGIDSPDARSAHLHVACAGDTDLRKAVEAQVAQLIAEGVTRSECVSPAPTILGYSKGDRVGRYRLIERLGEGGFGVVWRAEQTEPVRRDVAVKLIKPGMDSGAVLARFEAERQALALMDHPCIAKVLDAGSTDHGHPYFVMELVSGEPLDLFCTRRRSTLDQRLDLFLSVCRAVRHAHERGIVHRDLKPSNILVGFCDGDPHPKVIDFGIAKLLTGQLTEGSDVTRVGQAIGTPAYMSPEQLLGDIPRLDARSDVFSLGVVLYEMVTSRLPYEASDFRDFPLRPVSRHVLDDPVPRPSERLQQSASHLATAADNCRLNSTELLRELRNDLQDIILCALQKNPMLRYGSVRDLTEDIERYRDGKPLLPMPLRSRSLLYRLGKALDRCEVLRRTKVATISVCTLVLAVCVVSIVLVGLDWWAALGLFGEYGPGGLNPIGVIGMNAGGALLCVGSLAGGFRMDQGRWQPVVCTLICVILMELWAVSLLFGIVEYTAGGLLKDDHFRRVFSLLYAVLFGGLSMLVVASIPTTWLVNRYGRPTHNRDGARVHCM